jgi:WD40 repeat protein
MPRPILAAAILLFTTSPGLAQVNTAEKLFFSPNGKHFAANFHGNIHLGVIKGSERKFLKAFSIGADSDGKIYSFFGFTPDSRRLAVASDAKRELRFLSLKGEPLSSIPAYSLANISPGFRWAVERRGEGHAPAHNLSRITGKGVTAKFLLPEGLQWSAFSPDEKLLAFVHRQEGGKTGVASHILKVMDIKTGKYLKQYAVKDKRASAIHGIAFSPDGKMLGYAVDDKVTVVNTATWGTSSFLSSDGASAALLSFSHNGSYLAVNYPGASVKIYSLPGYKEVAKRNFYGNSAWYAVDMACSMDDSFLGLLGSRSALDETSFSVKFIDLPKSKV